MKNIEINIFQFLLLLLFIYIFTYYWLPKPNYKKTQEYSDLYSEYIKIVDEKNYWNNLYMQLYNLNYTKQFINESSNGSSIGTKNSSHSSSITPRFIDSNDNQIISEFLY